MNQSAIRGIALVLATCLSGVAVGQSVSITYSGRMTDGTGWGQSMVVDMTFWLCDSPSGATLGCLWSEEHQNVALQDGFFSVELGNSQPLPQPLPPHLWLAASVDGTSELSPWVKVGAVPYALQAREVAPEASSQSVLKAMKLALGYSDNPSDPNYLSDAAFISHQRGECPIGYARDSTGDNANYVVCKKGLDEIVKVGDFWIDRYEMSVWENADCSGSSFGSPAGCASTDGCDDYPPTFPKNGEWTTPLFACSTAGVAPSRSLTWFQAQAACEASGKHLCTNAEWQGAARGTPDPHTTDPGGDKEHCNIWEGSKPVGRVWATTGHTVITQGGALCVSRYGAYDMVGNLWEWTSDWAGQGPDSPTTHNPSDGSFKGDAAYNVDIAEYNSEDGVFQAAISRGGGHLSHVTAGIFAQNLQYAPSYSFASLGARCCLR